MSMFSRLFGGGGNKKSQESQPAGKAPPPPPRPATGGGGARAGPPPPPSSNSTSQSIQRLDDTIEKLELREKLLEKKIDNEEKRAKEFLMKKDKNRAMLCLKNKKMYEANLTSIMNQKANMETVRGTMESTALTMEVVAAQRNATNELEAINKTVDPDQVEEDRDRLADAMEDQKRINDAISQPVGMDDLDEDDLMEELRQMEMEAKKEKQGATATKPKQKTQEVDINMPAVPSGDLKPNKTPAVAEEEDDELARLEAELMGA